MGKIIQAYGKNIQKKVNFSFIGAIVPIGRVIFDITEAASKVLKVPLQTKV